MRDVSHLKHLRLDLSKRKGSNIKTLVMRETDGVDEEIASGLVKSKGGSAFPVEELVRQSIVEVDGQKVVQPFFDFDKWNSRTRSYVLAAWKELNLVEDKEVEDFLAQGEIVEVSPAGGSTVGS